MVLCAEQSAPHRVQDHLVHIYPVKPAFKDGSGDVMFLCDCSAMHSTIEKLKACTFENELGEGTSRCPGPIIRSQLRRVVLISPRCPNAWVCACPCRCPPPR